jgi:acetyl esterase
LPRKLEGLGVSADSLFFPAEYSPPLPHEHQFNLDIPAGQKALGRMLGLAGAVESKIMRR